MTTYHCGVSQASGFGVEWTETNLRRAIQQVRERVADGYQDDESGSVSIQETLPNGMIDETVLYRCVNEGGRAVKVNV